MTYSEAISSIAWQETVEFEVHPKYDHADVPINMSLTWAEILTIFIPCFMKASEKESVYWRFCHVLFGTEDIDFQIPDSIYEKIVYEFVKYGLITVDGNSLYISNLGISIARAVEVDVSQKIEAIHKQVSLAPLK